MKKVFSILVILGFLLSLGGCSDEITEGEVCDKEYKEEYTAVMMLPPVTSNGKTSSTRLIPYFVHYPDRYIIYIKAYQDEEWKTEDFYVSKAVYDATDIGDMFCYDDERGDLKEEPYEKERKEN